jgi:predicted MFS family arabinose efflux permease
VTVAAPRRVGRTVAAAALSTVVASLPVFLLGGLAVLVRDELDFGELQLGLAVSVFFAMAALSAVAAGRIAARLGAWATTVLAAALSAASLAGLALAPSYAGLLAALAVAGVANALAQIGSNQALAQVVPRNRQGLAFGVKQSAVPASTLLAGLALPVLGLTLGWRATFLGAALLSLAYLVLAPRPARRDDPEPAVDARSGDAATRPLAVIAVAAALGAGAANALGAFLVESAVTVGLSAAAAGLLLAGGSALGVAARLLVGWWADRRSGGLLVVVAAMLGTGAVGMALLATTSVPALVPGTALAFGLGWSWPGLLTFAVVRLSPGAPAAATSITQTGVFAGGATGPLLFGLLVSATSYRLAWSVAAVALLAAALLMLTGRQMVLADRARRAALAS